MTHSRIPEIYLIGAAKSATTLLANWLDQHPRIGLGVIKEPNFFSHDDTFAKGFDWYSSLYEQVPEGSLALDASTGYTRSPQHPLAAERLHAAAPSAKLIYMMRHPVDRAYSHFVHRWTKECHRGEPFSVPFGEYVEQDPVCVDGSNYQLQIETYLEHFPRESLLCIFSHEMKSEPMSLLKKVCEFLELEWSPDVFAERPSRDNQASEFLESRIRIQVTDRIKSNPFVAAMLPLVPKPVREWAYQRVRKSGFSEQSEANFTPPPLAADTRQKYLDRFAESTEWVERFTGEDLSAWKR